MVWLAACAFAFSAPLSNPQTDAYNVRVGTETFDCLYQFTTNTMLVETAEAITNLGNDTIKFYCGPNTSTQSGVTRGPNITNLLTLARDEPSYRKVFDMPFRHVIIWAYPIQNHEPPFTDGNYTSTEQAADYREMYDLTHYLLTNYNNSGRQFFLGHWEGDGYLEVNGWKTNPSPAVVKAMIAWLNNRQKAVDDARAATAHTNVFVYHYTEVNRVRDAMLHGPTNNVRVVNAVLPYVTNIDYVSYSSYDAQHLSASDLDATLDYIQSHIPTNKASVVPGGRIWIGEYGQGNYTTDAQEPFNRGYIQRLLNWNHNGQCLPFILFWEMYANYNAGGKTNCCLVDYQDQKVASWHLQNNFINDARTLVAQFNETNGRLPNDTEFSDMMSPLLNQPLPNPVPLAISNNTAAVTGATTAAVSGTLAQGIYGDSQAGVWVYYGRNDGGTNPANWESSRFAGANTNFNPKTFTVALSNLVSQTNYYYRFYTANGSSQAWAPASGQFSTVLLNSSDFGSRVKITFNGYNRDEPLADFPVLVQFGPGLPGFSYHQFASATGADLRFTDAGGAQSIPYEIDEWNTNGISTVWVQMPALSTTNDFIWAYWGNPQDTNPPASSSNGSVWSPTHELVWHLKENGFPYADSASKYPAMSGIAPASTPGAVGHAVSLNGSQYLDAGTVNLGNAFTLSAWINVSPTASDEQVIWANKTSGWNADGFALFVNSYQTTDGKLSLATGNGATGSTATTDAGAVTPGAWHYVAAVIDKTASTARLYVDGVDRTQANGIQSDFQDSSRLDLGRMTNGTFYFQGAIDEARVASGTNSPNWIWADWMNVASNTVWPNISTVVRQTVNLSVAAASGENLLFSWPGAGVGFGLFDSTNLAASAAWTLVTNGLVFTNNHWQIAVPRIDNGPGFFRLQSL